MFNFFGKKKKGIALPEIYKELISQEDYTIIVDAILVYFEKLEKKVVSIEDGDVCLEGDDGNQQHFYLDNLIRNLRNVEKQEWEREIILHFDKLEDKSKAYDYLYKDFEYAAQYLKVMVKPSDFMSVDVSGYVKRIDFPGTFTFLIFDFQEQFRYITSDRASEWGKAEEELFEIALQNIAKEEVEVSEYQFAERFNVFSFFSGDFSVSYLIDFEGLADGSMVAIPTKGSAFVHPIETTDVLELAATLYSTIEKFYAEDPSPITTMLYWYYEGQFKAFKYEVKDEDKLTISLPHELQQLFESTVKD
jgi:hypothetical protein